MVLIPVGVVLIWIGVALWSSVPELTIDNVDELIDDRRYAVLSRAWPVPFAMGVVCLISSALLGLRSLRMSLMRAANPSAVLVEVAVSKKSKKQFAVAAPPLSSGWSHVLMIREDSVSLWSGPPLRQKEFIEAAHVLNLEYVGAPGDRVSGGGPISLQWLDVLEWKSARADRRLEFVPLGGGPLGNSAPPPRLTADAVHRARALVASAKTNDQAGGSDGLSRT